MPSSALHPRSTSTSSLFSTIMFLAFMVVAAPHVLPCPAPHRTVRADGVEEDGEKFYKDEGDEAKEEQRRRRKRRRKQEQGRRCPIPRPNRGGGLVEEVLRFRRLFGGTGNAGNAESMSRKVVFEKRPGKGA